MAIPLAALAAGSSSLAGAAGAATALTDLKSSALGVVGKFNQIVAFASKFVQVINPALVAELNRSFTSLNAVIGTALQPVVRAAIVVIRSFADTLYPVMKQLQPIIEAVSNTIARLLIPIFNNVVTIFRAFVPLLQYVVPLFDELGRFLGDLIRTNRVYLEVVLSFWRAIANLIEPLLTDFGVFGGLRTAFQELAKAAIYTAAVLFKLVGWRGGLDALIRGLSPMEKQDTRGLGMGPPSYKAIADLGRDIYLEAFRSSAMGGQGPQTEKDFLEGLLNEVKALRDNQKNFVMDAIKNALATFREDLMRDLTNALPGWFPKRPVLPGDNAGAGAGAGRAGPPPPRQPGGAGLPPGVGERGGRGFNDF